MKTKTGKPKTDMIFDYEVHLSSGYIFKISCIKPKIKSDCLIFVVSKIEKCFIPLRSVEYIKEVLRK